jgi:hypothetical protein
MYDVGAVFNRTLTPSRFHTNDANVGAVFNRTLTLVQTITA